MSRRRQAAETKEGTRIRRRRTRIADETPSSQAVKFPVIVDTAQINTHRNPPL
jgi:hypothetical protein